MGNWQLIVLIVLAATVAALSILAAWYMRRIYMLRLAIENRHGYRRGWIAGRDHGYDIGVDDARRGVEYFYDWEGRPIDASEQAGPVDNADTGHRDGTMATKEIEPARAGIHTEPDHPGDNQPQLSAEHERAATGADQAAVPDNVADPVSVDDASPVGSDRIYVYERTTEPLRSNGGYFPELASQANAEPDRDWPAGMHELHCRDDRCAYGCDCPCHRGEPTPKLPAEVKAPLAVLDLLGDTDAFKAIHIAFDSLWTDIVDPPFVLPAWSVRCAR